MGNGIAKFITVITIGLMLAGVAWAAGCGEEKKPVTAVPVETKPAATGGGAAATTLEISMKNTKFNPSDTDVPVGTRVRWTNDDSITHTVTANDGKFDSGTLKKGEDFSFTFNEPGTYEYKCTIHPSQMKGKITVVP